MCLTFLHKGVSIIFSCLNVDESIVSNSTFFFIVQNNLTLNLDKVEAVLNYL